MIDVITLEIIGARIAYTPMKMKDLLELILDFLNSEYKRDNHRMFRKLKTEFKRLIKLYEFRLTELEYYYEKI